VTSLPAAAIQGRRAPLARILPGGMVGREWLTTIARPRSLAVRTVMPLLLAVPLVTGHAPTFWAGMALWAPALPWRGRAPRG